MLLRLISSIIFFSNILFCSIWQGLVFKIVGSVRLSVWPGYISRERLCDKFDQAPGTPVNNLCKIAAETRMQYQLRAWPECFEWCEQINLGPEPPVGQQSADDTPSDSNFVSAIGHAANFEWPHTAESEGRISFIAARRVLCTDADNETYLGSSLCWSSLIHFKSYREWLLWGRRTRAKTY